LKFPVNPLAPFVSNTNRISCGPAESAMPVVGRVNRLPAAGIRHRNRAGLVDAVHLDVKCPARARRGDARVVVPAAATLAPLPVSG
jgi:hypothetical protein